MNLYEEIKAAGIPYANHESDLYIPATPETRAILARHPDQNKTATTFINQAPPHVGERWLDVPFAFSPWWEARQSRG